MEMCPSTVWHLVFHYFYWCEGTINAMFILKTLLGRVCMQLLTYEDVSVCITLTLSPRLLTNVLLKNALAHTCSCFSYEDISISLFCHMSLMSVSRTFPLLLLERMSLHNFWHTRQRFWTFCIDRHVCTQVLRLRVVFMRMFCLTRTRSSGWNEWTMIHFQCKRHFSPYEAMGTRLMVRLRVSLRVF